MQNIVVLFPIPNLMSEQSGVAASDEREKFLLYHIAVTPLVTQSDDSIRDLDVSNRECRFPDETDGLALFKRYTKNNCLLECWVLKAYGQCNCTPWDYPTR
jgi:hypothetical protein